MGGPMVRIAGAVALVAGAAVVVIAAPSSSAAAATVSVTSDADDGSVGTLRWAVGTAGASPGDDLIEVSASLSAIELTDCGAGRLEVVPTGSLTVVGHDVVVTQTCPTHGVFGGAGTLSLDGVRVTGGTASGDGGGIAIDGSVTLTGSSVTFNAAVGSGGGIAANRITVIDSEVSDNYSGSFGGGLFVLEAGRIEGSSIRANTAKNHGGGVMSLGDLDVADSVVEQNLAASGGGLAADATMVVARSTIAGNRALSGTGGAGATSLSLIDSEVLGNNADLVGGVGAGDLSVVGSTISGNSANQFGGLAAVNADITGSAITGNSVTSYTSAMSIGVDATITNTTVSDNSGPGPVFDTYFLSDSSVTLDHATIVDNPGGTGIQLHGPLRSYASVVAGNGSADCVFAAGSGEVYSEGANVGGDGSCPFNDPSDRTSVGDPMLGSLGLHDGPTPNLVPRSGSPLLNQIPPSDPRCSGSDQRGFARPENGGCDIGAVEVRAVSAVGTTVSTRLDTPVTIDLDALVTDPDGVLTEIVFDWGSVAYPPVPSSTGGADASAAPPTDPTSTDPSPYPGLVSGVVDGVVTYTPYGVTGTDSFRFQACSAGAVVCTNWAEVVIVIDPATAGDPAPPVTPRFAG